MFEDFSTYHIKLNRSKAKMFQNIQNCRLILELGYININVIVLNTYNIWILIYWWIFILSSYLSYCCKCHIIKSNSNVKLRLSYKRHNLPIFPWNYLLEYCLSTEKFVLSLLNLIVIAVAISCLCMPVFKWVINAYVKIQFISCNSTQNYNPSNLKIKRFPFQISPQNWFGG